MNNDKAVKVIRLIMVAGYEWRWNEYPIACTGGMVLLERRKSDSPIRRPHYSEGRESSNRTNHID